MRRQLYNDDSHCLTDEEMKKYVILFMNDLRPVALTSAVMKAYQRIVLNKMYVLLSLIHYSWPIRDTDVSMLQFYMWQAIPFDLCFLIYPVLLILFSLIFLLESF